MATRSTKSMKARARSAARGVKKGAASTKKSIANKRSAASKRGAKAVARQASPPRKSIKTRESAVDRVTRVATEVAEQASHAVSEGVVALKELGANLAERVSGA